MHPGEGQLQAYTDHHLSAGEAEQVAAHLLLCSACQAQAQELAERSRRVQVRLDVLNPHPHESAAPISVARQRLQHKINQKESQTMFNKLFNPRLRPVWGALIVLVAVVVAFSFPQVRAAASSFLGLFRVQQVTVVAVDADAVSANLETLDGNLFSALFEAASEEVIGETLPNASRDEASAAAGIPVRLPEGVAVDSLSVEQGSRITLVVDQPLMQALFDETGLGIEIPAALDGATVTGEISPIVIASFDCTPEIVNIPADPGAPAAGTTPIETQACSGLIQAASPTINAPAGLDLAAIGEGYLQLMGMSAQEAKDFSQRVDWATTLVIPVPQDSASENVLVDGVEGVLLRESRYRQNDTYLLVWSKDGVLYALTGIGSTTEALTLANSLK